MPFTQWLHLQLIGRFALYNFHKIFAKNQTLKVWRVFFYRYKFTALSMPSYRCRGSFIGRWNYCSRSLYHVTDIEWDTMHVSIMSTTQLTARLFQNQSSIDLHRIVYRTLHCGAIIRLNTSDPNSHVIAQCHCDIVRVRSDCNNGCLRMHATSHYTISENSRSILLVSVSYRKVSGSVQGSVMRAQGV